jgi:hypothetical protein
MPQDRGELSDLKPTIQLSSLSASLRIRILTKRYGFEKKNLTPTALGYVVSRYAIDSQRWFYLSYIGCGSRKPSAIVP